MTGGIYSPSGALNVALNDATGSGAYTKTGKLRVTDVSGAGILDASGALRIASIAASGIYKKNADAIRYSDSSSDSATGVQFADGSLRMAF